MAYFGGDLDKSSEGDERLVDKKFLSAFCCDSYFAGRTIWFGDLFLFPKKVGCPVLISAVLILMTVYAV